MKIFLVLALAAALRAQSADPPWPAADAPGPNLPAQKIGVNDLLSVTVYRAPEVSGTVRVGSEGAIALPLLADPVPATGILPRDLEARIAAALKSGGILVNPIVKVTVAEYASRPISVAGAVRKPVTFQAAGRTTLLEAITRAEGLSEDAGEEILVSIPGEDLLRRVRVKGLIDAADPALNLLLHGGEEIRVPEAGKIYVVGNVKKPGAFAVRDSSEPSLLKMLALAEGVDQFASRTAFLYRADAAAGSKREIPVELDKILKRKAPDLALQAGDILYIPNNQGRRIGIAALEKALLFGSTAGATALVWR